MTATVPAWVTLIVGLAVPGVGVLTWLLGGSGRRAQRTRDGAEAEEASAEAEERKFTLVEKLDRYLTQIGEIKEENRQLKATQTVLIAEGEAMRARLTKVEGDLALAHEDRTRLLRENDRLRTDLSAARVTIAEQGTQIAALQAQVHTLERAGADGGGK